MHALLLTYRLQSASDYTWLTYLLHEAAPITYANVHGSDLLGHMHIPS